MMWIAACTVIVFLMTRGIPQTPPLTRARPLSPRLNPASIVVGDDVTVRPA